MQAVLEVVVVAVPGAPLVHYCTRVGFVQGVTIGRRKRHQLLSPIVLRFKEFNSNISIPHTQAMPTCVRARVCVCVCVC